MKRHIALQDLSRDHHRLLLQAREIRWCLGGDERAAALEAVVATFLREWEQVAIPHLQEEEEVLLPLYARYAGSEQEDRLQRITADHAWLRDRVAELMDQGSQHQDTKRLLGHIGRRLHDHVRFEERVVFQHVQAVFSEAELTMLHERSLAFRSEWRSSEAIGPRRGSCSL